MYIYFKKIFSIVSTLVSVADILWLNGPLSLIGFPEVLGYT